MKRRIDKESEKRTLRVQLNSFPSKVTDEESRRQRIYSFRSSNAESTSAERRPTTGELPNSIEQRRKSNVERSLSNSRRAVVRQYPRREHRSFEVSNRTESETVDDRRCFSSHLAETHVISENAGQIVPFEKHQPIDTVLKMKRFSSPSSIRWNSDVLIRSNIDFDGHW